MKLEILDQIHSHFGENIEKVIDSFFLTLPKTFFAAVIAFTSDLYSGLSAKMYSYSFLQQLIVKIQVQKVGFFAKFESAHKLYEFYSSFSALPALNIRD